MVISFEILPGKLLSRLFDAVIERCGIGFNHEIIILFLSKALAVSLMEWGGPGSEKKMFY